MIFKLIFGIIVLYIFYDNYNFLQKSKINKDDKFKIKIITLIITAFIVFLIIKDFKMDFQDLKYLYIY